MLSALVGIILRLLWGVVVVILEVSSKKQRACQNTTHETIDFYQRMK